MKRSASKKPANKRKQTEPSIHSGQDHGGFRAHGQRPITHGPRPTAYSPFPEHGLHASSPIDLAERMNGLPSVDRSPLRLVKRTNIVDVSGRALQRRSISLGDTEERLDRFLDSAYPETDADLIA